ncbi:MAG: hypothetical protein R2710_18600 [Acidimicrobiales bacterium]
MIMKFALANKAVSLAVAGAMTTATAAAAATGAVTLPAGSDESPETTVVEEVAQETFVPVTQPEEQPVEEAATEEPPTEEVPAEEDSIDGEVDESVTETAGIVDDEGVPYGDVLCEARRTTGSTSRVSPTMIDSTARARARS